MNELLESEKFLSPPPSVAPGHVLQISVIGKTGTINTLSTVTPIVDICPSIADNPASSPILKSANLDEPRPKSFYLYLWVMLLLRHLRNRLQFRFHL